MKSGSVVLTEPHILESNPPEEKGNLQTEVPGQVPKEPEVIGGKTYAVGPKTKSRASIKAASSRSKTNIAARKSSTTIPRAKKKKKIDEIERKKREKLEKNKQKKDKKKLKNRASNTTIVYPDDADEGTKTNVKQVKKEKRKKKTRVKKGDEEFEEAPAGITIIEPKGQKKKGRDGHIVYLTDYSIPYDCCPCNNKSNWLYIIAVIIFVVLFTMYGLLIHYAK